MSKCPEEHVIQAFMEGALASAEAAEIDRHVDTCAECRQLLATLALGSRSRTAPATRVEVAPTILDAGAKVGRYRVLRLLGHGGMGVVYAAFDEELRRTIALKLVSTTGASSGSGQRSRILREARAIAKLSHPNVVTVYDVGPHGDGLFIAMELVEGGTVREALAERRPPWREVLALYRDAARGLAAAHGAGMVHRDFKPDNVLLGKDGRVRVADFGLARAAEDAPPGAARDDAAPDALAETVTKTGAILGTPAYMAPEQMRGEETDARADEFSFCVALYEGLYRERPFAAATFDELRASVEAGRVRPAPADAEVPGWLRAALLRGLAARPEDRFATMEELLAALEEPRPPPTRWRAVAAGVALLALTSGGVALVALRGRAPQAVAIAPRAPSAPSIQLDERRMKRVTFAEGCEEFPSFSPDGATVFFDGSTPQGAAIFALELASGSLRKLTGAAGTDDIAPAPSPDGTRLAFSRRQGNEEATWVVPLDGGAPRRVAVGDMHPRWTADGRQLWTGENNHPGRYDPDTGEKLEEIAAPKGSLVEAVVELPDHRLVLGLPAIGNMSESGIALLGADHQSLSWLLHDRVDEAFDASAARGFVFAARVPVHGQNDLLALPLDGAPPTPLLAGGLTPRKGLAVSRDGTSLVWSTCRAVVGLTKVDEGGFTKIGPDAEWDDFDAAVLPGTDQVVVVSSRGGPEQLWVVDLGGAAPPRVIPTGDVHPAMLAVSPAGDLVAFTAQEGGIYVVPSRGDAPARNVCPASDVQPSFARDGRLMFTRRFPDGSPRVMITTLEAGGAGARPFLPPWSVDVAASPADDRVVYTAVKGGKTKVLPTIFDPRTGASRQLSPALDVGPYDRPRFSPDGKRVALTHGTSGVAEVDVATGAVVRDVDVRGTTVLAVTYGRGGALLVVRALWTGDLWAAEGGLGAPGR